MNKNFQILIDKINAVKNIEGIKKVLIDIVDELSQVSNDVGELEDFDWEEVV